MILPKFVKRNTKSTDILEGVKKVVSTGADTVEKFSTQIASKSEEVFRNKSRMKQQMLSYGVVRFYNDGLEKFMNI